MNTAMDKFRIFADDALVVANAFAATRFSDRLIGLLQIDELPRHCGLLLEPSGSVHTFGMSFAIDIVFLDRRRCVLATRSNVPSGRVCWAPRHTHATLELWSGACEEIGMGVGQQLVYGAKNHVSAA